MSLRMAVHGPVDIKADLKSHDGMVWVDVTIRTDDAATFEFTFFPRGSADGRAESESIANAIN